MAVVERLAWVIAALVMMWLAKHGLRFYQARGLRHLSASGQTRLIVFVSSRCVACRGQKSVVARLRERYPADLLSLDTIDAEGHPAQARKAGVVTVPTTVLVGADGAIAHINNGFTRFEVLARQIDDLLAPITHAPTKPDTE